MADDNKNAVTGAEGTDGAGAADNGQTPPEKKYTDEDVNNISTKNSAKAVAKLMKELGITKKTDKAKVKALIEKAALDEAAADNSGTGEDTSQLTAALAEAQATAENAVLENLMLSAHVQAGKVARAAKLIDRKDCLDDDGKFSREKAAAAVTELLKDWTDLVDKPDGGKVGFSIGADGTVKGLDLEAVKASDFFPIHHNLSILSRHKILHDTVFVSLRYIGCFRLVQSVCCFTYAKIS